MTTSAAQHYGRLGGQTALAQLGATKLHSHLRGGYKAYLQRTVAADSSIPQDRRDHEVARLMRENGQRAAAIRQAKFEAAMASKNEATE